MKLILCICLCAAAGVAQADSLSQLSESFWAWRAYEQPFSEDDIPRIERPADLTIDWSSATLQKRRQELGAFEQRLGALEIFGAGL